MAEAPEAYSLKNDGPAFKLAIRLSETREKLNTLAQSETLTEDQDQEMRSLTDSYPQLEAKWRAAAQVEQAGKVIVGGEANELRQLEQRVELRSYMHSLMNEKPPQGAELELQQHYNLGVNQIPWAALDPLQEHRQRDMGPEEHRADTVTAGSATVGNQQQDIIRRVFAMSCADFMGVQMPAVGVGETLFIVLSSGTTAAMKAKDAAQDATAAVLSPFTVSPTRLTARYLFRREDMAVINGYEPTLRSDLDETLSDQMDHQILRGNGTAPNVNGFMSELADPTDPSEVIDFANSIGTVAAKVDGKYASMMSELKALVGPDTYQKMASTFQAGSGESAESYLTRKLGGFKTNSNMPDKTNAHIQKALVYQSGRGVNSAFAPVWAGGPTVIRDEISEASKGRIALTIVTLWGFKIVREDPYSIVEYKLQ